METDQLKTLILLFHGLAQPKRFSNGLGTAHDRIIESDPRAFFILGGWKADPAAIADGVRAANPRRVVGGFHSFGAWWACEFARAYGEPIDEFVFADGVGREPRFSALIVPNNVKVLRTVRKVRKGMIRASEIIVKKPTVWAADIRVNTNHASVDESEEFQAAVLRAVKGEV
jgi:hypothetical protein